jgi:hypothetical protein
MRRVLLWSLAVLGVVMLALGSTVLLSADGAGLPAPDPQMPIHLGDGSVRTLEAILALSRSGQPLPGSLFQLAESACRSGRLDEAQALYLSIPPEDPHYAKARRRLAWELLTKAKGQPGRAVMFAKQAVAADPLDGDSWHGLMRVCGATLGIDSD